MHYILKQFIKFGLVGVLNTVISQGLTYGIIFFVKNLMVGTNDGIIVFLSSLVGFIVSVLNSYYWNNKYVFKKTSRGTWVPLLKTYICYGTTWVLSFLSTFLFANIFSISVLWVPILSMVITIPLNFIINKYWAFK